MFFLSLSYIWVYLIYQLVSYFEPIQYLHFLCLQINASLNKTHPILVLNLFIYSMRPAVCQYFTGCPIVTSRDSLNYEWNRNLSSLRQKKTKHLPKYDNIQYLSNMEAPVTSALFRCIWIYFIDSCLVSAASCLLQSIQKAWYRYTRCRYK